mmetsp:Transcript_8235/g.19293  ORF Transcript_8235/g.19293 Transcript_8235/m.19293 type:complete len:234 (+) Transcript_8235:333-1034(+)
MEPADAAIGDHDGVCGLAAVVTFGRRTLLHDAKHILARDHLAKADMLSCEAAHVTKGKEELRSVGVLARVAHREHPSRVELHLEARRVVLEAALFSREYALPTTAIVLDKIAALRHKALDDAVELAPFVRHDTARFLPFPAVPKQERHKVLDRQRRHLEPDLDNYPLWRHLHRDPSLLRPLEVVCVQRLLDPLQLRAAQVWQPVGAQVVRQVFRSHKVDGSLVSIPRAIDVDV